MNAIHIRGLIAWGGILSVGVLLLLPLSMEVLAGASLGALLLIVAIWWLLEQRWKSGREPTLLKGNKSLPEPAYVLPVVLICELGRKRQCAEGPGYASSFRFTDQGCYLRVVDAGHLARLIADLTALRPQWRQQLNVLLVINPQEHADPSVVASELHAFNQQLMVARRTCSLSLPLSLMARVQCQTAKEVGFVWHSGRGFPDVKVAGSCESLSQWQASTTEPAEQTSRMQAVVEVNSVIGWLKGEVIPFLVSSSERTASLLTATIIVGPAGVNATANSLWCQWVNQHSGLSASEQAVRIAASTLPDPDYLLERLPNGRVQHGNRTAVIAGLWIFSAAGLIALFNSAWQNTLLVRQVTDDLHRYAVVSSDSSPTAAQFGLQDNALLALRQDAKRLDGYYREGEPLSLGLGLYRADHLRKPLWEAIARYKPSVVNKGEAGPVPVQLDSLSLFNVGSAELKPESAKVLINALVNIKARPGWLIVITGHTDFTGDPTQNIQLSRARAEAVRDWMQRIGDVPTNCLAVLGAGSTQPVASNDNEHGRTANRRVDIRLVPEEGACAQLASARGGEPVSPTATP